MPVGRMHLKTLNRMLKPLTTDEAAWLAGIYEGEGTIAFKSNGKTFILVISIAQNGLDLPLLIKQMLGIGSVTQRHNSMGCTWQCQNADAVKLVSLLWPHMRIPYKKDQLLKALYAYSFYVMTPNAFHINYTNRPILECYTRDGKLYSVVSGGV